MDGRAWGKWLALWGVVLLWIGAGCRVNELPDYLPRTQRIEVSEQTPPGPEIAFGASQQRGIAGIVTTVATFNAGDELSEKLEDAADPQELSTILREIMEKELKDGFKREVVGEGGEADAVLELTLVRYGMTAASPESEIFYFAEVEAEMIYLPEDKLVWEMHTTISKPLKDFHLYSNGGLLQLFSASSNLDALEELTPEQLREIFLEFAQAAGQDLAAQMREDANDR